MLIASKNASHTINPELSLVDSSVLVKAVVVVVPGSVVVVVVVVGFRLQSVRTFILGLLCLNTKTWLHKPVFL